MRLYLSLVRKLEGFVSRLTRSSRRGEAASCRFVRRAAFIRVSARAEPKQREDEPGMRVTSEYWKVQSCSTGVCAA